MDNITQALLRAKSELTARTPKPQPSEKSRRPGGAADAPPGGHGGPGLIKRLDTIKPSWHNLYANHVVAFDPGVDETRYYDILRNQVMPLKPKPGGHVIAVTGPTLGCGASVTALNLAVSIARMPATNVLAIDANADMPSLSAALQFPNADPDGEKEDPAAYLAEIEIGDLRFSALRVKPKPGEIHTALVKSAAAAANASVIVIDAPPMLQSDTGLPWIASADCVVLVLAKGQTTLSELDVCKTYLAAVPKVQMVLNKGGRHGL